MQYLDIKTLFFSLLLIGGVFACDDDDPVIPNEEELITTLTYTLTPVNGGNDVVFQFQDTDGDGGADPVIINGIMEANTTYEGSLVLLNESQFPAEDITQEVRNEDEDHQLFYQPGIGLNATIEYDDSDSNGNPVGLQTTLITGGPSVGQLTIILRHEPNKSGIGVSDGNIANAGGETDIQVVFDAIIQ